VVRVIADKYFVRDALSARAKAQFSLPLCGPTKVVP
jgi:hypothetical protein